MNINIKTIPHKAQRYDTCGDWWFEGEGPHLTLEVRVSQMPKHIFEWLVAEHEINEALACYFEFISENTVSDFDQMFEDLRKKYPHLIGDHEPGDMVSAPYHKQHKNATKIEKLSAELHGVDWEEYGSAINSLVYKS